MGGVPELCKIFCPTVFSFTAAITAMLFAFWCRSFRYKANDVFLDAADLVDPGFGLPQINLTNVTIELQDLHFGPWYQLKVEVTDWNLDRDNQVLTVHTRDNCIKWRDVEVDSELKLARAASVISVFVGATLTAFVCFTPCFVQTLAKLWKGIALFGFILICTLFQGLTFMVLKSEACDTNLFQSRLEKDYPNSTLLSQNVSSLFYDDDCSWDEGSSANVVAIVCWFLAGCTMLVLGDPKEDEFLNAEADKFLAEQAAREAPKEEQEAPAAEAEETGGETAEGGEGKGVGGDGDSGGNLRSSHSLGNGKF